MTLFALSALATDSEMYFSADKNGASRVTNVQEGDEVWIVVYDPDENIDCDLRDKIWTDVKIMDPKTGAYIIWETYSACTLSDPDGYEGKDGCTTKGNFLEETGADTGLFVSNKAFQIGTREDYTYDYKNTHVVDDDNTAFQWGHYLYDTATGSTPTNNVDGDDRGWFGLESGGAALAFTPGLMNPLSPANSANKKPSEITSVSARGGTALYWLVGRFENMDTLVGMYKDQNDGTDVAVAMMKIIDTEATISWDKEVYKDGRGTATITVVDADENLNCNKIEYVPVFVIVNPGSWNPVDTNTQTSSNPTGGSPTNFCMLKDTGGVDYTTSTSVPATEGTSVLHSIRWYNIYNSTLNYYNGGAAGADGRYYIQYAKSGLFANYTNVTYFDTVSDNGVTAVSWWAQETGVNTGVFQLNLNSLLVDLGFNALNVRDVLVAYYLDPNDFDDFKLATAYIEERNHSLTSFTNATRADKDLYWIGRDPVYVQVIDANANVDPCCPEQVVVHICDVHGEDDSEWVIADETSSNSPVFFTNAGMQLWPVWDALGVGLVSGKGGYQLSLDNWKLEVFNEDSIYARYNDVYYMTGANGMTGLGDMVALGISGTVFPPRIDRIRVANDVSFDMMEIADTQVYNGETTQMYFLDRQGNRVSGYVNSDCVFIEVIDFDQDEDQYRRERIDAYWDGGQNWPFGPQAREDFSCDATYTQTHSINALLGSVNIFNDEPTETYYSPAKLYVLNPRSGRWAAMDLLETGVATGDFVSVICVDLNSVYSSCVPTLGVLPGDTIIAAYQDPSNHSDSAWISIKVGIGGGGTPPTQQSTTMFVDVAGVEVANYTDADTVYVKVIDPSHSGSSLIADAVEIDGVTYDLAPLAGALADTFITDGLALTMVAGDSITATYTDPTSTLDTSSDTISIIASELSVDGFYAGPSPFEDECSFSYTGSGIASVMSVEVYDLTGTSVWADEQANVTEIVWDGTDDSGASLANGAYIYVITATDGTNTFNGKATVFINR